MNFALLSLCFMLGSLLLFLLAVRLRRIRLEVFHEIDLPVRIVDHRGRHLHELGERRRVRCLARVDAAAHAIRKKRGEQQRTAA